MVVNKKYRLSLLVAIIFLGVSGCSNSTIKQSRSFKETPDVSRSNMSDAISCMGSALKQGQSPQAYIFLVRNINDGTIKDSVYQDSSLSDAGRVQMINVLSQHLYPHIGLVTDTFPLMFSQTNKETVGLNRFGLPSVENQNVFMRSYRGIIQSARQSKKLAPAKAIIPLIVSGSFTRFDKDNLLQTGSGQNMGSRNKPVDSDDEDARYNRPSGQIDIGNTQSARALSLVINLTDPRNNLIVSSQALDLIFYRHNKSLRLRIALGGGYYGISKKVVTVEGVHSAQKTLIDAAALWLLNKAYGGQTNFSSCFTQAQRRVTLTIEKINQIDKASLAAQTAIVKKTATTKQTALADDKERNK